MQNKSNVDHSSKKKASINLQTFFGYVSKTIELLTSPKCITMIPIQSRVETFVIFDVE